MIRYPLLLSQREILQLFRQQVYRIDIETGEVRGPGGTVKPYDSDGHLFVRLYHGGQRRKAIAVARLVWMVRTKRAVPQGFEIHHRDENRSNNHWSNLLCLHRLDHEKFHHGLLENNPLPF